ncbi:hypothetical protein PIB30_036803 [Stylosanthes scabra]|uniref:Protein FAR1-RELATED SEQUENCE n=1 Tax=Stylosanthes scabra TaxID=79078 RepID=A0ABU6ZCJ5_9FABA|nr:hypothetical protein [Stylosanthes scabra]
MSIAIQSCMPTTIHRWCIWHIMKKIPQKMNGFKSHVDIEQEMSRIRNDLQSPIHVRSRGRPKKRLGANTDKKIATATRRLKNKRKVLDEIEGTSSLPFA